MKGDLARLAPALEREMREGRKRRGRRQAEIERERSLVREQEGRRRAEKALERTTRLQALTAMLSTAMTLEDFGAVVAGAGVSAVGAMGGRVAILSEDGLTLQTLRELGPSMEGPSQGWTVPLGENTPVAEAVRTGLPVWLPAVQDSESRYLETARRLTLEGYHAAAILPISAHDEVRGVVTFGFEHERRFGEEDRAFILSISQQIAQTLERASLYESVRRSEARFHAQFLAFPDPTYVWQVRAGDLVLVDHNDAGDAITQQHVRATIGTPLHVLYADEPEILEDFATCLRERGMVRREMHHRLATAGTEHDFVVHYVFLPPDLVMVRTEDVTDRVQAERNLRFQARLLDMVGQSVIATTPDGEITYWNRGAERLFLYPAGEVVGRNILDVLSSEHSTEKARQVLGTIGAGQERVRDIRIVRRDGSTVPVLTHATPVYDDAGAVTGIIGVSSDITERRQAEESLQQSERRYRGLFESSPDGIAQIDHDGLILMANAQLARMLGYETSEAIVGVSFMEHLTEDERPRAANARKRRATDIHADARTAQYRVMRKDGSSFPAEVRSSVVRGSGTDEVTTATIRDVTERAAYEAQLQHLALHDAVTELPNLTLLQDRLQQNLSVAQRAGECLPVLVLDLDEFRGINEMYGRCVGDQVLHEVGARLSQELRESDTLARLDGDEFGIILPETDLLGAVKAAAGLSRVLEQAMDVSGRRFHLGASVGVALYPDHAEDGE